MKKVRVPPHFQKATLSTVDPKLFYMIHGYYKNIRTRVRAGRGLLIAGPPGVGKTWSIAALTRAYAELPWKVDYEFVTAPILIDNLPAVGDQVMDTYRGCSYFETYTRRARWLVINDLGKEYRGGKLAEQVPYQLGKILRMRRENDLVTHITTNLTGDSIEGTYGDSLTSLLSEIADAYSVIGPDLRGASK